MSSPVRPALLGFTTASETTHIGTDALRFVADMSGLDVSAMKRLPLVPQGL